jgi:hypothetical protein
MMTREEAMTAIASEVLADPEWTARVVVAALVANDQLDPEHPAFTTLVRALTNSQKGLTA